MRKTISDPDYVYRPLPKAVRQKMSAAHRKRRGIPDGHRLVYGVLVPVSYYRALLMAGMCYRKGNKSKHIKPHSFEETKVFVEHLLIKRLHKQGFKSPKAGAPLQLV
jgi:hypothetical protein